MNRGSLYDSRWHIELAKRVISLEAQELLRMQERLGEEIYEAVEILYNCKGRVVVTGMGKSGIIARKIAATLASTGTPSLFLHPAEGIHGDLGMVMREDAVIALSNSGETPEVINLLPSIKRLGIPLVALTGNPNSTLAKRSDVVLDTGVSQEACPLGIVPTASTTSALAMGDALAVVLLERRGFKKEDFALFHPGGSLGKRLLLTVEDLMHKGEEIPKVNLSTPLKEAIIEISSKRLGITTVLDEEEVVRGVITDGDLRRIIEREGEGMFGLAAGDVMTRNPKTITKEALAAKALNIMEKHSITALVVVDPKGRPEGLLHMHDILKAGVV